MSDDVNIGVWTDVYNLKTNGVVENKIGVK